MISGVHYGTGKPVSIRTRGSRIEAVRAGRGKRFVGPGLVDLQVNGFVGLDLNTPPVPADLPGRVTRELWKVGVTSYLATIITNSAKSIEGCVRAIARACGQDPACAAGIAGIHLEGPFISPEDGPRGAHAKEFVTAPDWDSFRRWQDAAGGRVRLITLSPEWPGANGFIEKCAGSGVTVSIGHTAATPQQVRDAVKAGASMSTHLGNGAHVLLRRHPNYLWEQLAHDGLRACIIADGFHLPDAVMKVFLRVKGRRAMLVSDAVYLSGLAPGTYETHIGGKVVLTPEGRLHLAGNPDLLAGATETLAGGVAHLVRSGLCGLKEAWEMASVRPAAAMGLPVRAGIKAGGPADLVLFEFEGGRVRVIETWKGGVKVYETR